jgi:DNA-binding transcriptional regulator YhcF (GntR family)
MPKAELAKLLGTTPETLSRCFTELNQQGAINIKGRDVHIMRLKKLPEFCQD